MRKTKDKLHAEIDDIHRQIMKHEGIFDAEDIEIIDKAKEDIYNTIKYIPDEYVADNFIPTQVKFLTAILNSLTEEKSNKLRERFNPSNKNES